MLVTFEDLNNTCARGFEVQSLVDYFAVDND